MRARASPTQMRFPVDTQETEGYVSMVVNKTYWDPTGMPSYQLPPRGTREVATSCLFAEILPGLESDRLVPKDP